MFRLGFRAKLMVIVGSAAVAFLVLILTSALTAHRVEQQLTAIQNQYVPRVDLQPKLVVQFERLRRGFQDAVGAHDSDALERTRDIENTLLEQVLAAKGVLEAADVEALRKAVVDYYGAAYDVSKRLISGETGEPIVESMAGMQAKHARAELLLKQTTAFDQSKLDEAFSAVRAAQASALKMRLAVTFACLALVLALSLFLSRGALRALTELGAGFERFGRGRFSQPITVEGTDELSDVAQHANKMAASLERVDAERERTAWLERGRAGLADEVRGQLEPDEVARRAVAFVARHLDAPAAVLYWLESDQLLRPLGEYAHSVESGSEVAKGFRLGEGLVGQAARAKDISVVLDPPAGYLRVRSGLGEAAPKAIVFLPLVHDGEVRGVIELATFKPWTDAGASLLLSVRESVAIAIDVARQRARLTAQEERLRSVNDELQAQQEELRQTNEELTTQTEVLARQGQELSKVSAYKSQFLANMSHELRTPLNSMLLLSQLLAENEAGNLTDKQVEYSKTIHGAGTDLLSLINQVLDLAKVEAGKEEVRIEDVTVRDFADHATRVFGALARRKSLDFVVECAAGVPETIATDRQRVVQILNNLLGNAIKFTDRGQVALRIGVRDTTVSFAVSDTGVGIAPEHQEHVFQPFEQVEGTSDRRFGGTGLGLTIAREMTALLGGELHLQSEPGVGSTFVCYLPVVANRITNGARRVAPPVASISLAPHGATATSSDPSGHLLVIEDDRVFAAVVGEVIEKHGIECVVATDGRSGLQSARARRPRGIILDVKLPDVDGWQVMEELRNDRALSTIPIHFISAIDGAARGIAMGAVGYLTKPASAKDLASVVESLAPKRSDRPCRILVVEENVPAGESLVHRLERDGCETRLVGSVRAAQEALAKEKFDCLILDLSLPDMDGLALMESLGERCGSEIPGVVVYTGRPLTKAEAKRLEAHADAVIMKEGSSGERLLAEIRLFVRRVRDGLGSPRRPAASAAVPDARLEGRKVLLADDDMRTVYALSATLRAKGAEVIVADTGRAAIGALESHPDVDVVLMDIMMPEMDGYQATRLIRENARHRTLPIIALTAKAMKGDREKCLEAGATDYLPKPIDAARLFSMLNGLLGTKANDGSGR